MSKFLRRKFMSKALISLLIYIGTSVKTHVSEVLKGHNDSIEKQLLRNINIDCIKYVCIRDSLIAQLVKNLPAV